MKLGNLLKEISQEEVDAEVEGAEAAIDAAKAKLKASQASIVSLSTSSLSALACKTLDINSCSYS